MTNQYRCLVGDRTGQVLAEIDMEIDGTIPWRMSAITKTRFSLARTDEKFRRDYLEFGNRILFRFDNGLPDWGGVIDPPRDWKPEGVGFTAYSGEYLLSFRKTDRGRYFSSATVGEIFTALINEANAVTDMGISVGDVWAGGDGHSPDYHLKSLLEIIQDSLCMRLSTADFEVAGILSNSRIGFTANLYERRGIDRPGVALIEGQNVTRARLIEQGPIYNAIELAGADDGNGWGSDRITSVETDAESQTVYGLREYGRVYSDVSIQETLDTHAANTLSEYKDPHNMLELTVLNDQPSYFADYELGDRVTAHLPSYGFEGFNNLVRIMGREFDPASGECTLVVREEL